MIYNIWLWGEERGNGGHCGRDWGLVLMDWRHREILVKGKRGQMGDHQTANLSFP